MAKTMSKAEDRYLEHFQDGRLRNCSSKESFLLGYHQAEKDLELTNADVYDIWRIYNEVCTEGKIFGFDETSQEVLKRFKSYGKKEI